MNKDHINEHWILVDEDGNVRRVEEVGIHKKEVYDEKVLEVIEYCRVQKLVEALETLLRQPFGGSWDAQAVYIQKKLKAFKGDEDD